MIVDSEKPSAPIDVPLNKVAAEPCGRRYGALEVDGRSGLQTAKRRTEQGFARDVRGKRVSLKIQRGQTNAIYRNRVAVVGAFGHYRSIDDEASVIAALFDTAHAAELFDDACKHACYRVNQKSSARKIPITNGATFIMDNNSPSRLKENPRGLNPRAAGFFLLRAAGRLFTFFTVHNPFHHLLENLLNSLAGGIDDNRIVGNLQRRVHAR